MKQKLIKFLNNIELHMMVILMMVFIANIFIQIFFRVVFNKPLFFTEEISRYAFLWMVFLGMSYATLYNKHIRITFVMALLPKAVQKVVEILLHVLAIVIFAWIFVTSLEFLRFSADVMTPALRVSKAVYASILPVMAVLTMIRSVQRIVLIILHFRETSEEAKT